MVSQSAFELRSQLQDCPLRLSVSRISSKLYSDCSPVFEGMSEKQKLAFRIDKGTSELWRIPGGSYLSSLVLGDDSEVRCASNDQSVIPGYDGEGVFLVSFLRFHPASDALVY